MSELKFIHLTDTHILREYTGSFLEKLAEKSDSPTDQFVKILKFAEAKKDELDFLLITGDLVHEGDLADYEHYKAIIEEHTSLPVHLCLGNHDTAAFWKVFHNKDSEEELYYTKEINGYRLIVLDSSHDKSGTGAVSEVQLNWLKDELKTDSENGTIVAVHHPLDKKQSMGGHSLTNTDELLEALKSDDVIAVLSGHIHTNKIEAFPNFISSAAEGTCFGVEFDGGQATFTNNSAFNIVTVKGRDMELQVTRVPGQAKAIFEYDLSVAMQA